MAEEKKKKGFFGEFKEFISRGNIMDMAVGMIVGSAFTAIVTALSNGILKPVINFILATISGGNDPLASAYTFLKKGYEVDEAGNLTNIIDLSKSIYIDWGAFLSAIINFLLVALVLFLIVKAFNKLRETQEKIIIEQKAKIEARKQQILEDESKEEKEEVVSDSDKKDID